MAVIKCVLKLVFFFLFCNFNETVSCFNCFLGLTSASMQKQIIQIHTIVFSEQLLQNTEPRRAST